MLVDKERFIKERIIGRKELLGNIVDQFRSLDPIAIHQFGSGGKGYTDEFSDLDIWVTFADNKVDLVLQNLGKTFREIAPVLVRHYSRSWSPVGGSANSVIHETSNGLFVVDYYISKYSETVIKADAVVLYGDDSLKRGDWRRNIDVDKDARDIHSLTKDLDTLIDLLFISTKGIVRRWKDDGYINNFRLVYRKFRQRYQLKMKRRRISLSFRSNYRVLSDLNKVANKRQRRAITKVKKYLRKVEQLYG